MRTKRRGLPRRFAAGVGSTSRIKIRACELAKKILGLLITIQDYKASSRVSRQPEGLDEMLEGAIHRAAEVLAALGNVWLVFVVENGKEDILGQVYDTPLVYIQCRNQLSMEAWGHAFPNSTLVMGACS